MPENLYSHLNEILEGKQLSISAITRELKEVGISEHRLVMTGYLRALRDLKKLNEVDIPPSKVYIKIDSKENTLPDIYSLLGKEARHLEQEFALPVAVYVITNVLDRPVFKEELQKVGFSSKNINDCLSRPGHAIKESRNENLKEYTASITRITIPVSDSAYEADQLSPELLRHANHLLLKMLKLSVDISGLTPRTKKTTINDFG
ncbi:hypothetical protein [Methanolobus chelungpuianus]|uniref:Uncharacterized protein n=1 Tax=Methanolobus chelungpuianus TaxID=502115 RepID=A0AAE3KW99_9EURY|nr:hypothetical protein [Methanolobus chelungpuianus]MCQ6962002.1 hypothetical protein [Methanolobus chelungpuianus]